MQITGYTDQWTLAPGQRVGVKVSSRRPTFFARLVRHLGPIASPNDWLVHSAPIGETIVCHSGQWRPIQLGSYFSATPGVAISGEVIGIATRIFPTSIGRHKNSVCALEFAGMIAVLQVEQAGNALLSLETAGQVRSQVLPGLRLHPHRWQEVSLEIDRRRRLAVVTVDSKSARVRLSPNPGAVLRSITVGADNTAGSAIGNFDGKVESPRLYEEKAGVRQTLAYWSFAGEDMSGFAIADRHENAAPGQLWNGPLRGVTSSRWNGSGADFSSDPLQYDAVRLSRDDLGDAQWPDEFVLAIPEGALSGAYSVILSVRPQVDWEERASFDALPLFVVPAGKEESRLALVLPTFSYRAYANSIFFEDADPEVFQGKRKTVSEPLHNYAKSSGLRSLYDLHEDGSGCHLASLSRPQTTVRADFVSMLQGFPHQFSADLEIIGFLQQAGVACSVLTDEYLHAHGAAGLRPYDVVITGSHPEYATAAVLDAYLHYAHKGGSIIYLGGNGFYWSVALSAGIPSWLELRRDRGTWSAHPGEMVCQTDGERGGLWRNLGRPPNAVFGIGYSAVGFSGDGRYALSPELNLDALTRRLALVLKAIGAKPFGIAGLEVDAYDQNLGSSPDAVVVASTVGLPDGYVPPVEHIGATENLLPDANMALKQRLRGDIVFERLQAGGLLFAVGSIRWASGLSDAHDPFFVRAITEAVIRDFLEHAATRTTRCECG